MLLSMPFLLLVIVAVPLPFMLRFDKKEFFHHDLNRLVWPEGSERKAKAMGPSHALTGMEVIRKHGLGFALASVLFAASLAMLLNLLAFSFPARAANAIIHWDASMIFAGQNNGNPWGPVGENALVHGENFPPDKQLSVILAPGNSNNGASVCNSSVATVGSVTTSGKGTFSLSFTWPSAAGSLNGSYSICSLLPSGGVASFRDDGPFTVLSSSAPSISVSPTSLNPGDNVIVSGQNWVPPQQVSVSITGSSPLTSTTANSSGLNSGTFSVTITISSNVQPGSYVVSADTGNNLLHSGTQNISIALAPTPTPTATATATATPAPTPTTAPTATNTPGTTATAGSTSTTISNSAPPGPGSTNTGGGGPSGLILGLFAAIALIILAAIGLIIYMVLHRSSKEPGLPIAPGNRYNNNAAFPAMTQEFQGPVQQDGIFNAGGATWQYGMSGSGFAQAMPEQQNQSYNIFDQPTSFASSAQSQTFSGQPTGQMPEQSANAFAPACLNCGRLLLSNAVRCDGCGMPVSLLPPHPSSNEF
jgi:hypothetical protein